MSYTKRRSYMVESDSPQHYSENAANMPIYEDTSDLFSRSSRNFNSERHALSDKLELSSTPSNSSALKALQDYGTGFSTDVLSSAGQKHNVGKHIKDVNNFGNLNLNSVDEEDEFLYGDSNSLPEEPKPVQNNPEASVNRSSTGWSDEDDYYRDSSISQTNQKSKMKNNPVTIMSGKIQPVVPHKILGEKSNGGDAAKIFSEKKKKTNSSQIINSTHSSMKTIEDHNVSHYIKSINVVENNVPDYSYLPEIPTSGTKSKYHAAAQILKKPTEKHDLRNKLKTLSSNREAFNVDYTIIKKQEHPRIELSNKPIGKRTVVLPKTMCRSEEKELSSNRRILSLENQRHIPKYFQPKELDHIKSYLKDSSRHYDSSTREHAHELRSSVKSPIDISPGRHCSPSFESARVHTQHVSRSPSLESSRIHPRYHSPYTSRHRSPGYKYKYRSPPHVLRHKSPLDDINRSLYEYRSKHTIVRERTRRYSRSPPQRSRERSPRRSHERSPRRSHERSPRRSLERSPTRHSRERSPARHSRERSPARHSRERSPARHSRERSPARHSREKSPAYYKHRDRSQNRPRVKSKSPVYHKSRDHSRRAKYFKTTDDKIKKKSSELGISKKHHYSKDGQKSRASSSSSFCSLSFESHSLSSDSLSEGSTRDMRDSKKVEKSNFKRKKNLKLVSPKKEKALDKLAVKSADIIPSKFEEECEILSHNTLNTNSEKQGDSDLFKNLSAEDKEFYNAVNDVLEGAGFVTALISAQQSGLDNIENPIPISKIEDSTTPMSFLNEDVNSTLAVSNQPMSEIPFSQLFPFNPAMHPMPAPYSPVSNYGPLMPSPMLPPHVPPSPYYNPYVMPEMNVDMDYPPPVEPKQVHKKRPTTLRSIPVSDNLDVAPAVINSKPSLSKSEPKPSNLSPEKLKIEAKEKASPKTQSLALKQSKVQESHTKAQENNALLENYKKLKADRHLVQSKLKRITGDIIEMKKMVDETYPWNIKSNMDSNDRILYGKCNSIIHLSSETLHHYSQEARRLDEDFQKVKEKLPKELAEVAKLTTEDCITEPVLPDVPYIIFDSGKNVCSSCSQTFATVAGIMEHLHSAVHKQNTVSENMWKSKFRRKPNNEKKIEKNSPLHPISGIEFMKPTNGFFCTLCREHCIDNIDAEYHLKSPEHLAKFKNHTSDNPLYENKYSIKRYIGQSLAIRAIKEKRKREAEENEKQIAKRRKEEVVADKKVKEKIKDQQSKEKIIEELEEKDTDNLSSNNRVLSGIKVTLSGDKLNTSESKTKEKPIQKVVYIGKAPNYKAAAKKTRPLPWYKRDAQSEKPDINKNSSNADIVKKLKEKIASKSSPTTASFGDVEKESEIKMTAPLSEIAPPEEKSSVSTMIHSKEVSSSPSITPSEVSSEVKSTTKLPGQSSITLQKHPKASTPKREIAYTCLTEKESKNLNNNNIENKEFYGPVFKVDAVEISKSKSLNCENDGKTNVKSGLNVKAASSSSSIQTITKSSKITGVSSLTKKDSVKSDESKTSIQNTDSTTNHSSNNLFYGTASTAHQDNADTSGLSAMSQKYVNELIHKDISSAQNIPLSKMKLTELPNISQQPSSLLRDNVNEPIPMDISPTRDFHMEFPDFSKPPPLLLKENITEPVHRFSVSQPPPLIRESINDPTPIEFLNVSVPPPPLLINKSTPIDFPSNRDFQIGFPDVSKPPPSFPRDTTNEPVPIINFQNFPTQPRKFTEEENDFRILGINKSDFMPLVIPVPPPLTLLHQSSYVRNVARAESPALFPHDVGPGINKVEVPSTSSIEVIQNSTMFLPTKVPSFKKQAPKSNKSNQSNLITISTAKGKFVPESKDLKSGKTPEQSNTEQFDTLVSKVEENEKDMLLKSDTKKLTPAKIENSVKSECVDIKGEVKKQSSESKVEIITIQSMVPRSFDCSVSIEKLQKEGKIQKTEPKLDVAAKKIAESEKDTLKNSCIKQLPSLKIQNNMTSECDEIEQDSTGSEMTKLITVLSETSNVSETVVEDLKVENSTKKSDEFKYDICTEKVGDQTGKLEKSSIELVIPHELKKNLTEKTLITMKYVRSENTDLGSKIKEPHEAQVEKITPIALHNTVYGEPTNKMEESGELSLQKCDMESLEKNNVGSDCEVNKSEVKAILHDTKMENLACTSIKCVESKKELAIKKDESRLLCELYDEPMNEMEVSWEHSLKKCDIGSSQNDCVGSDCEVNKNEVKEELHDTKMENLASTSPNFGKSEKESAMKMASTTEEIPKIEVEMRKRKSQSLCKLYDEPNNKMEESKEHSLQKYLMEFLKKDGASSDFEGNKTEVKEVLHNTEMENLACTSLDTVESEKESAMKKDESHSQCKLYDESINEMEESRKHSLPRYDVESLEKDSVGSDCEVNKSGVKEILHDAEMESLACKSQNSMESEKELAMKKDESLSHCKLYDEPMNKMELSRKHSLQKYDVESLVKVNVGSDCEVNKSEVKEVLHDTKMENLACTSQNSVESQKDLAIEIEFRPQENSQIEDEMRKCKLYDKSTNEIEESGEHSLQKDDMESLKKNSVGSDCEFNKNEVKAVLHDAETDNLACTSQNSVESEKESATKKDESQSLCKLYDEPMNEMEKSQKYSLQKYETEPLEKDSMDPDWEINKNGVEEVLHYTEMESLACRSPNCVESEKGLAMKMASITEEISSASKKITIAEKVIPHIEVEVKKNEDQSLIDLKSVELVSSECPIASKADVNTHKTEGDKLLKSNIVQFVSLEVENMTSGCDEINAKLHCSEYENSLVLHSSSESQTNLNKELTCVTYNDSVTSKKDAVTEKKIEEIEKFEGSLITLENLSNCIEFLNKKKSEEKEKLNSEKLISLEAENNLSSECIIFIKNEDTIGNVHKSDVAEKNNEQKESERDISPLSSYTNSAEPECNVDKNAVDNDLFLCIKDNDVEESNMIYDEQQEAVSIKTRIPTISKSNECSLGSKKGITIDNDVELLMSEKCQDEIFVKEHKVYNSKSISPVKQLTSKDLNLSCQSVMASETMPILISENASEDSNAIKHEQSNSNSTTLFDPPILQSENLRSTEKINEKLVIDNESSMIQKNLCIEQFEPVTTNKHTEQNSEQPSTCDISVLKPEFLIKSTLEPSEFSMTKTQDIISKNKTECKISRKVFSFPQESLAEGDYINLIDSSQLSKISDCNKSTAVEYNLSTQASVDGNFTGISENVSKLDPVYRSNLSENDSTISEQQKSKSKEADSESLAPEVMDCNPSLETDDIDTEAGDRTSLKLTSKSQEQVLDYQMDCSPVLEKDETNASLPEKTKTPMEICCLKSEEEKSQIDYFLSFINDEKIVTEPSKTDGEGSDTDEYNNEIN